MIRTYSEMIRLPTYEERVDYLRLGGQVGADTFGFDRVFNQRFYTSREWRRIRNEVLVRDRCCDLACPDREIFDEKALIHHIVPITMKDIEEASDFLFLLDNLVTVTLDTHQLIHYGNRNKKMPPVVTERTSGDTCPWKQIRKEGS